MILDSNRCYLSRSAEKSNGCVVAGVDNFWKRERRVGSRWSTEVVESFGFAATMVLFWMILVTWLSLV